MRSSETIEMKVWVTLLGKPLRSAEVRAYNQGDLDLILEEGDHEDFETSYGSEDFSFPHSIYFFKFFQKKRLTKMSGDAFPDVLNLLYK